MMRLPLGVSPAGHKAGASLGNKVDELRVQLGIAANVPIINVVDTAIEQLGVKPPPGATLVHKVDQCFIALGGFTPAPQPMQMWQPPPAMVQPAMVQPTVMIEPVAEVIEVGQPVEMVHTPPPPSGPITAKFYIDDYVTHCFYNGLDLSRQISRGQCTPSTLTFDYVPGAVLCIGGWDNQGGGAAGFFFTAQTPMGKFKLTPHTPHAVCRVYAANSNSPPGGWEQNAFDDSAWAQCERNQVWPGWHQHLSPVLRNEGVTGGDGVWNGHQKHNYFRIKLDMGAAWATEFGPNVGGGGGGGGGGGMGLRWGTRVRGGQIDVSPDGFIATDVASNPTTGGRYRVVATDCGFATGRHEVQIRVLKRGRFLFGVATGEVQSGWHEGNGKSLHQVHCAWTVCVPQAGLGGNGFNRWHGNRSTNTGLPWPSHPEGQIITMTLDCDAGTVSWSVNGNPGTNSTFTGLPRGTELFPVVSFGGDGARGCSVQLTNASSSSYNPSPGYSPPVGYSPPPYAAGLTPAHKITGCWWTTLCPIPWLAALYHTRATSDDTLEACGIVAICCAIPCPFQETRTRIHGTNRFVHHQDGNNVLTYDDPCFNCGQTNDGKSGLLSVRFCCIGPFAFI